MPDTENAREASYYFSQTNTNDYESERVVTAIGTNAFSDNPGLITIKIEASHLLRFTKMHLQIAAR